MKRSVIFVLLVSCILSVSAKGACFKSLRKNINRYKSELLGGLGHSIQRNQGGRTYIMPGTSNAGASSTDGSVSTISSQQKHVTAKETITMETILLVISGLFSLCLLCLIFSSLRDKPKETQNHYPLPAGCIFLANGGGIMIRKRFF